MDEEKKKPSSSGAEELILGALILLLIAGLFGAYFSAAFDWYGAGLAWLGGAWASIRRTLEIVAVILIMATIGIIFSILDRLFKLRQALAKADLAGASAGEAHTVPLEQEAARTWADIRALTDSDSASDWNMAVLRADALVDDVLAHQGYEGTTLAERLKIADPIKLPSLDSLWSAHRLRNAIAHDPSAQHTKETIAYAIHSYEAALKELGIIA